jgi:hypothetical protein
MVLGAILSSETACLRGLLNAGSPIEPSRARDLIRIEISSPPKDEGWRPLFIQAVTVCAVHDASPSGYLTAENADWLLQAASLEGRIATPLLFDALLNVVATARWCPQRLIEALLDEVCIGIESGIGALRTDGHELPGVITAREVDVVRSLLVASGASEPRSLHRGELQRLIAIDAACGNAPVYGRWADLFCKAMLDAAMNASGRSGGVRRDYLVGSSSAFSPSRLVETLKTNAAGYKAQSTQDRAIAALECQRLAIITGDAVMPSTVDWLCAMLDAARPWTACYAMLFEALSADFHALDPLVQAYLSRPMSQRTAA